jgi:cytochrome c nitrite reductase small subunit
MAAIRSHDSLRRLLLPAAFGLVVGLGIYALVIGRAHSYLSNDPYACVNCHVMNSEYTSWRTSSHAREATCVDCHVPEGFVSGYAFKARDGVYHSWVFTLGIEPEVIRISSAGKQVVQDNCVRCHDGLLHGVHENSRDRFCVDCHRDVPHTLVISVASAPNARVPRF